MPAWIGPFQEYSGPTTIQSRDDTTTVMLEAVRLGASEVIFQTGRPVLCQVHGRMSALTKQWLQPSTLQRIATDLSSSDSIMSKLYGAFDFDRAITVEDRSQTDQFGDPIKQRFRINITANQYEGDVGLQIVCRHIPDIPPTVETLNLETEIVEASTPGQGAVIIAGETGSGKTTTFAALIRRVLETDTPIAGNIITYEAPIEFVFDTIESPHSTISQHEIGQHLKSFADGVRNSLRRKPALIVIGELRDMETILAAVEASATGHPIYTTTHANDVAHIMRRMTLKFPPDLQSHAFHDILSSTHMMISQLLVPRVGGGRICLREWQILSEDLRREIVDGGIVESTATVRSIIQRCVNGQSMNVTVLNAYRAGAISEATARRVLDRYEYKDVSLAS